ncbi:MAG: hypothetical protein ACI9QN_002610 [Arcticibacterium sp.]|jgi:hypothetical protein
MMHAVKDLPFSYQDGNLTFTLAALQEFTGVVIELDYSMYFYQDTIHSLIMKYAKAAKKS